MTGMGREAVLVKDHGQAGPKTSGVLNQCAFGAMTAILDVSSQRRRKPSGHNGLKGDRRHRYRQDGKSGRNSAFSIMGQVPDSVQAGFSAWPASWRDSADAPLHDTGRWRCNPA